MAKRKNKPPEFPTDNGGPFDRFADFTRRILAVPKAEVDAAAAAERAAKRERRAAAVKA